MPAADALKQQDRWESVVEPGQLPTSFMRAAQRRQVSLVFGWSSMPDYWRSRVPARNREYRTPRVGRSHFGGGGSGSRSAVPTYPQPPHKWTTSPERTLHAASAESISALAARQPNTAAPPSEKLGVMRSNTWSARLARQRGFPEIDGPWRAVQVGENAPMGSAESLHPFMKSGASQTRQCLRPAGSGR